MSRQMKATQQAAETLAGEVLRLQGHVAAYRKLSGSYRDRLSVAEREAKKITAVRDLTQLDVERLEQELRDAEIEKEHLKAELRSLDSANNCLQAQLAQARAENVSHLREIAALRRPRPVPPIEYDGLCQLPLEYVHVYEEC